MRREPGWDGVEYARDALVFVLVTHGRRREHTCADREHGRDFTHPALAEEIFSCVARVRVATSLAAARIPSFRCLIRFYSRIYYLIKYHESRRQYPLEPVCARI